MQAEGSAAPGATAVRSTGFFHPDESSQVFTRLPGAPAPTIAPAPRIVIARSAEELARHRAALDDLAAAALEANVFYEPILAEAAVRSLGAGRRLELVLVYRADPGAPRRPPQLLAFLPFERVSRYRGVPVAALVSFQHVHCFLCTPLVRRQGAREAVAAVSNWLTGESGVSVVELRSIAADGPVHQLFVQELDARRRTFWLADWSTRALFEPSPDAERYLRDAISGLALKEVRRKERRLGEQGPLVWRELAPGEDARPWLEDFLRLEASGWKGREGSAIACTDTEREFFLAAASALHARGQLMLLGLFLDGRPLALKCNFLSGDGGFAFKIAFDEAYRPFSPGFLLEVENIRRLHQRTDIRWMDSCATSQHAMINRLWPGRRTMATLLFATGRGPGDLLVSLMPLLRWARRKFTRRPRHRTQTATIEGSPVS
jgi:CelD/BcsL family acetyltransferase involved in cellulose biosynthesis